VLDSESLVGSSGNPPGAATLTAGSNVAIVNTPGGISIRMIEDPVITV